MYVCRQVFHTSVLLIHRGAVVYLKLETIVSDDQTIVNKSAVKPNLSSLICLSNLFLSTFQVLGNLTKHLQLCKYMSQNVEQCLKGNYEEEVLHGLQRCELSVNELSAESKSSEKEKIHQTFQ